MAVTHTLSLSPVQDVSFVFALYAHSSMSCEIDLQRCNHTNQAWPSIFCCELGKAILLPDCDLPESLKKEPARALFTSLEGIVEYLVTDADQKWRHDVTIPDVLEGTGVGVEVLV